MLLVLLFFFFALPSLPSPERRCQLLKASFVRFASPHKLRFTHGAPAAGRSTVLRSPRRREHPGLSKTRQGWPIYCPWQGSAPQPPSLPTLSFNPGSRRPASCGCPAPHNARGAPDDPRRAPCRASAGGERRDGTPLGGKRGHRGVPAAGTSSGGSPGAPCARRAVPSRAQSRASGDLCCPVPRRAAGGRCDAARLGSARLGLARFGPAAAPRRSSGHSYGGPGSRGAAPGCWAQSSRYLLASGLPGVSVRVCERLCMCVLLAWSGPGLS